MIKVIIILSIFLNLHASENNYKIGVDAYKSKDYHKALMYLKKDDTRDSNSLIAYIYTKGLGVDKNNKLAAHYNNKACLKNHPLACFNLAIIEANYNKSIDLLYKSLRLSANYKKQNQMIQRTIDNISNKLFKNYKSLTLKKDIINSSFKKIPLNGMFMSFKQMGIEEAYAKIDSPVRFNNLDNFLVLGFYKEKLVSVGLFNEKEINKPLVEYFNNMEKFKHISLVINETLLTPSEKSSKYLMKEYVKLMSKEDAQLNLEFLYIDTEKNIEHENISRFATDIRTKRLIDLNLYLQNSNNVINIMSFYNFIDIYNLNKLIKTNTIDDDF